MKGEKVKLIPQDGIGGAYTEYGTDVTWVRDTYTEPRDTLYDCVVCEEPIEEWNLFTCLDGGEAAHIGCVVRTTAKAEEHLARGETDPL
jgi:hypothetical protein